MVIEHVEIDCLDGEYTLDLPQRKFLDLPL